MVQQPEPSFEEELEATLSYGVSPEYELQYATLEAKLAERGITINHDINIYDFNIKAATIANYDTVRGEMNASQISNEDLQTELWKQVHERTQQQLEAHVQKVSKVLAEERIINRMTAELCLLQLTDTCDATILDASKRSLMAMAILEGLDKAWLDVINQVLPGEGIEADDYDVLQQELMGQEASKRHYQHTYEVIYQQMSDQVGEIDPEQQLILSTLTNMATADRIWKENNLPIRSRAEEARLMLLKNNIRSINWLSLIDRYFGEADQS